MKLARGVLAIVIVVLVAAPAVASPEDVANDISQSVMSPFCKGVTLHDCPSPAAAALRERIEGWAEQGWSKDRIIAELEDEYGSRINATPDPSGWGLVGWLLPLLLVGAGLGGAFLLARKWIARPRAAAMNVSREDHARIETELAALRETQ